MNLVQLLIIAVGLMAVMVMVWTAFAGPSPVKEGARRLQGVRFRHSESTKDRVEAQLRKAVAARKPNMHQVAGSGSRVQALAMRLHRTGKNWTLSQYLYASLGLAVVVALLIYMKSGAAGLALAVGLMVGVGLPHMVVGFFIKKRNDAFTSKFPDAIELLVRGLRSGLPVSETLMVVSHEVPGPVGEEFKLVTERIKIGKTMEDALQETADRLNMPEFSFFCITLAIQRETGGNLAETLANLADVLRKRSQMKLKIRAMSSESKASAYIVGSLPFIVFIMIWWINPQYLEGFFTDDRLIVTGLGGLTWMSIGAFIMAKMVSFESEESGLVMIQTQGPTLLGFDVIFVGTVMAVLATIAAMLAIYAAVTVRDPMARRVKALNDRREQLKAGIVTTSRKRASLVRKNETTDRMRETLSSLKVLQDSQVQAAQQKLAQAGIRKKEWAVAIIFARMVAPVLLGGIAGLIIYVLNMYPDWGSMKKFMVFAGAVGLGYKGPDIFVQNKITKRTDAIRKGLPDALDLLVICAEAGLTVDAAFNRVARELGRAYPELGDEFALTAIELSFLTERRQAFENLAYRVNLDSIRGVVTTMIQTERYGTPLASALRVLSAEFRNERMMRAEEKAARLPAIMTVPLILFILPVLFVVILGPAACSIADAFSDGGPGKGGG